MKYLSKNRNFNKHTPRTRRMSESRSIRRNGRYMTESARFDSDLIEDIYDNIVSDYNDIKSMDDIYDAIYNEVDRVCMYTDDCLDIIKEFYDLNDIAKMAADAIINEVDNCGLATTVANELGIED